MLFGTLVVGFRSFLHSFEMLAFMVSVSMIIPRNKRQVEGPSILDDFTGASMRLQRESIAFRAFG